MTDTTDGRRDSGIAGRFRRALAEHPGVYSAARRIKVIGRYLVRRPHEPDFAAVRHLKLDGRLFLDVGANSGQSALSFRLYNRRSPILSVEANPALERELRLVRRILPRFSYLMYAAGAADGPIELSIPMYRDVPISGEATMVPDGGEPGWWALQHLDPAAGDLMSTRRVTVPCIRLDTLDLAPGFVKIDVEGAAAQVVEGLWQTIVRWRPVLLIEADTDLAEVTGRLEGIGYTPHSWDAAARRLVPVLPGVQNVFLLPQ